MEFGRIILLEFPAEESIRTRLASAEHRAIAPLREAGADTQAVIVEGIAGSPAPPSFSLCRMRPNYKGDETMSAWNSVLWGIQIILSIKLLSVAFSHGLRPSSEKMKQGVQRIGGWSAYFLTGIAILSVLTALGLLLPAVVSVPGWAVPAVAGLLAGMFLVSLVLHRKCRENANPIPMIVLFLMAVFVALGRWLLAPL